MICPNCGKENVEGAGFCAGCGNNLTVANNNNNNNNTLVNDETNNVVSNSMSTDNVVNNTNTNIDNKKNNNSKVIVIICILLILIIILFLVFGLNKGKKLNSNETTVTSTTTVVENTKCTSFSTDFEDEQVIKILDLDYIYHANASYPVAQHTVLNNFIDYENDIIDNNQFKVEFELNGKKYYFSSDVEGNNVDTNLLKNENENSYYPNENNPKIDLIKIEGKERINISHLVSDGDFKFGNLVLRKDEKGIYRFTNDKYNLDQASSEAHFFDKTGCRYAKVSFVWNTDDKRSFKKLRFSTFVDGSDNLYSSDTAFQSVAYSY